jgi:ATP-dependent DNA helicase DinG
LVPEARARLDALVGIVASLPFVPKDPRRTLYRFPLGQVPDALASAAAEAARAVESIATRLDAVHEALTQAVDGGRTWERVAEAEDWVPIVGSLSGRVDAIAAALAAYAERREAEHDAAPNARWVSHFDARTGGGDDYELVSVPLDIGPLLADTLWERCAGALCTSATLTALGSFERFLERSGLAADQETLRIRSPFRYGEIATFAVPAMRADPRDVVAHTAEVALLLPGLLAKERSALVLFTSWRQLEDVVERLPTSLRAQLKVQGNGSKQQLLDSHRQAIDRGEPSYVVGVASFAEGVDLPDDYCRHVIIAKLPFAVPDDPLDAATAEWIEASGRNPFVEISLPDAALRLVQACGRLIRHERDYGRITLLDKRIVTQRYGRMLLDSLPPFRREVSTPAEARDP